jgi:hypothetical protein
MRTASLAAMVVSCALVIVGLPARAETSSGGLVEIVSPAELERFDCYPVEILIEVDFEKLREAATPGTFLLRLNRREVVDQLEPTDTGFRVLVSPEDGLRVGSSPPAPQLRGLSRRSAGVNFLQVIIAGPDGRLEFDRRRFVVRLDNDQPPMAAAGLIR